MITCFSTTQNENHISILIMAQVIIIYGINNFMSIIGINLICSLIRKNTNIFLSGYHKEEMKRGECTTKILLRDGILI
jgi:hypothetical protein